MDQFMKRDDAIKFTCLSARLFDSLVESGKIECIQAEFGKGKVYSRNHLCRDLYAMGSGGVIT